MQYLVKEELNKVSTLKLPIERGDGEPQKRLIYFRRYISLKLQA